MPYTIVVATMILPLHLDVAMDLPPLEIRSNHAPAPHYHVSNKMSSFKYNVVSLRLSFHYINFYGCNYTVCGLSV